MKYQPLLAIALLVATTSSGSSKTISEEQLSHLQALHGIDVKTIRLSPFDRAYLDAYDLLSSSNQCRQFFGTGSQQVLDEFVSRLQIRLMSDTRVGIRMSGIFTNLVEPQDGLAYRLFEHSEINSRGAFYSSKAFPADPFVPNKGSFRPNTRKARVLILLHELAHLIKGKDGKWLVPDDGNSAQLSSLNTETVESKCGEYIRALS